MIATQRAAIPRLYRIDSIRVGDGVDLVDITTGARVAVADKAMSTSAQEGNVIVAAVYPAGRFHFASMAGPVLPPMLSAAAGDFLESQGVPLDQPLPPQRQHLIGRLWKWSEEHSDLSRLRVQNTAGHTLRWHSATFTVADQRRLVQALAARDDVEADEGGSSWTWFEPGARREERVSLGTLESLGDRLLLEVNSRERFARARAWLEAIEGVRLGSVSEKEFDPRKPPAARSLDDRLPTRDLGATLPPEALRQSRRSWSSATSPGSTSRSRRWAGARRARRARPVKGGGGSCG
jgi:hypothetical protein